MVDENSEPGKETQPEDDGEKALDEKAEELEEAQ